MLALEGFPEIEDVADPDRSLIRWSGVGLHGELDPNENVLSLWPDSPLVTQEDLLHHPSLPAVCESICKHGNHSLTGTQVRCILEMQTQGMSCRAIGKSLSVSHVAVFRAQKKLNEWALLIESRDE